MLCLKAFSAEKRLPTCTVATTLSKVKNELNNLIKKRAEFAIHRVRVNHYFHGNRPSHLLADKSCNSDHLADVATIMSENDELLTDPELNHLRFIRFYNK